MVYTLSPRSVAQMPIYGDSGFVKCSVSRLGSDCYYPPVRAYQPTEYPTCIKNIHRVGA